MTCPRAPQVEELAAGRLSAGDARGFEDHLKGCAACAAELARVRAIRDLLAGYRPVEPNDLELARLDRRVAAAMDRAFARPADSLWRDLALAGGLAAAAALLVFVSMRAGPPVPVARLPQAIAAVVSHGPGAQIEGTLGGLREAAAAPEIAEGDRIEAGGGLLLVQVGPATGFALSEGARASVERLEAGRTAVKLEAGDLVAEVKPLGPQRMFDVHVADLVVSVRGTAFWVRRLPAATRISVAHGAVQVTRPRTGESAFLSSPASLGLADGAPLSDALVEPAADPELSALLPLELPDAPVDEALAGRPTTIASEPPGAWVRVGGGLRGTTPLEVRLPAGRHGVRLERGGFLPLEIDIEAGESPAAPLVLAAPAPVRAAPPPDTRPSSGWRATPPSRPLEDPAVVQRREAMMFEVRSHMRDLARCYERAMKASPHLAGKVTLSVALDAAGAVQEVTSAEGDADPALIECATESIRSWSLPGTGDEERFELPLVFAPKE